MQASEMGAALKKEIDEIHLIPKKERFPSVEGES